MKNIGPNDDWDECLSDVAVRHSATPTDLPSQRLFGPSLAEAPTAYAEVSENDTGRRGYLSLSAEKITPA